jgi:hypothetical protein
MWNTFNIGNNHKLRLFILGTQQYTILCVNLFNSHKITDDIISIYKIKKSYSTPM